VIFYNSLNTPIIAIVGFNLFTLIVFMTAPVFWDTNNLLLVYLFVLLCQLLILIGFTLGRNRGALSQPRSNLLMASGDRLSTYLFAMYVSTFLVGYAYKMGLHILDIAGIYNLLLAGIIDRHLGYDTALTGTGIGPIHWTLFFVISIFNQIFFIVGFIQWKKFTSFIKALFVVLLCIDICFSVGRGTAFGVISMVTTFFLSSMLWLNSTRVRTANVFGYLLLVTFLFAGSIALFSYNLYNRSGNVERGLQLTEFGKSTTINDHVAFLLVPEALQPTYMNVVSYLGQGYYNTSLALDLDFKSTWFLGNNPALISLASAFGFDVWDNTYIHRLELKEGVDEFRSWHSAYTWFASDVSFYGVPFLLFFIAYMFGFSWAKAMQGDFLSKLVFVMLGNILLFLFANNSYLSTVFYSFMFLLPFWVFTRLSGLANAAATTRRRAAMHPYRTRHTA
jgi:hypothetical protein